MTIRVGLVDLPGLLTAVVLDAFKTEPDIDLEVLPAGSQPADILASHPDIVIAGIADPRKYPFSEELLHASPILGLLAISPDGRQAWIHEMRLHVQPLADVSGGGLREAVRAVARRAER